VGIKAQNRKNFQYLVKKLPLGDKSPCATFTILDAGEGVTGPYPHANVHGCGFKNVGLQALKSPKLLITGMNARGAVCLPVLHLIYSVVQNGFSAP